MKRQSLCPCGQLTTLESSSEAELNSLQKDYKKCKICGSKLEFKNMYSEVADK